MLETCLCCGEGISEGAHQFVQRDRRKGLVGAWRLVQCDRCGVIAIAPAPTDAQLAAYYAEYYRAGEKICFKSRAGARFPRLRKIFHRISGDVDPRDFVDVTKDERVLDYGCGHAGYLSDFHRRGVRISGAELSMGVVDACIENGFDVHKVEDFSHIPFDDLEFDVVYLMQVFEHLRDPSEFMAELSRILRRGGVLYLAVPNAASFWRKVFKDNWVSGWFTPFHLYHYSRKSLTALAEKHGFVCVESWTKTPESWFRLNLKAFLYPAENSLDLRESWIDTKIVRYFLMLILRLMELSVRERDCLVVKLRKQ